MAFVDVGGRAIWAESHGHGPVTVLLLHGAGSNAATWWQQLPAFAARHTVLTMDQRSFGRSVAPLDEFTHPHLLRDAVAVLDHFGVQRAVVVGQSLGGMVGLRLALAHPSRVAAFVSCDSPLGIDHPAITAALEQRARTASSKTLEQRSLGAWFLQREPERAALYAQINAFNPATYALPGAEWRAAMDRLMDPAMLLPLDALRALTVPTLWLLGREDPLVPLNSMVDCAARVPGSELAVVDDCGHSTYFEKPAVFNHLLLDFIARRVAG